MVYEVISRGNSNTRCQTFGFPNLHNKIGPLSNQLHSVLIFLILVEIKLHTIPHLKALNSGSDITDWQG